MKGKVYLVGAGPGDPGLSTLRARETIFQCDVLVYDHLANPELRKWALPDCEQIDVGKSPGRHTVPQEEIGKILVSKAKQGKMVVRLKGGDPFVFGRCAEEMSVLDDAEIDYEIVPGVTAALACAEYAGIPLSHRDYGSSISFLTGHEDVTKESLRVDFTKFAEVGGTLCIYMGISKMEEIVEALLKGGLSKDKPAAVVSNGTLPTQRHLRCKLGELLAECKKAELKAPAIIFVGNAVGLSFRNSWFEDRPLYSRRIAITRSASQNSEMKSKLKELGAQVLELPLIRIIPTQDRKLVTEVFSSIATYDWVVFTSANGAREFMRLFFLAYGDIRSFGPMRIACVGDATAEIFRSYNLEVELTPKISTAENLAQELVATDSLDSANVLVITGNRNREVLVNMLETVGHAIVDSLPLYETDFSDVTEAEDLADFKKYGADAVLFTSSSTALSYVEQEDDLILEEGAKKPILCSFGPETSRTLKENDLIVSLEAETPSMDQMIAALISQFKNPKNEAISGN